MPELNEDRLQRLGPSIVEIISDKEEDSTTLGTGFIVTDDGLVVTCRHVIADSQGKLMNSVKVRFHYDSKTDAKEFTASPVNEEEGFKVDSSVDIAFLRLDNLPEKGVIPVMLDDKVISLNHFASIGFKKAKEFKWLSARGDIGIPTEIKTSEGLPAPGAIELHSNQIEPGMSGAPVLDIERDRVVGIISDRYKEEYNPAVSNMAFALPVISMVDIFPKLREKN
jgi:S1-C subfamily serine protease